jgi:hypothetical protein
MTPSPVRAAVVQAGSLLFDTPRTLSKLTDLTRDAAGHGAVRASTRHGQIVRYKCNRHSWFRNRSVTQSRDLLSHQEGTQRGMHGVHAAGAGRDVYPTEAAESGDLLLNGNSLSEAAT